MAFIPAPKIGDQVIIKFDLHRFIGTFTKGHSFTIYSRTKRGDYNLVDDVGLICYDTPARFFEKV